jgi:hypothetical protein
MNQIHKQNESIPFTYANKAPEQNNISHHKEKIKPIEINRSFIEDDYARKL